MKLIWTVHMWHPGAAQAWDECALTQRLEEPVSGTTLKDCGGVPTEISIKYCASWKFLTTMGVAPRPSRIADSRIAAVKASAVIAERMDCRAVTILRRGIRCGKEYASDAEASSAKIVSPCIEVRGRGL